MNHFSLVYFFSYLLNTIMASYDLLRKHARIHNVASQHVCYTNHSNLQRSPVQWTSEGTA